MDLALCKHFAVIAVAGVLVMTTERGVLADDEIEYLRRSQAGEAASQNEDGLIPVSDPVDLIAVAFPDVVAVIEKLPVENDSIPTKQNL